MRKNVAHLFLHIFCCCCLHCMINYMCDEYRCFNLLLLLSARVMLKRTFSGWIRKRFERFGVITFPYCEMRNEFSHLQPISGCAFCLLFLLFAFCFRCVRTRLLFYIGVFWQSEIIWCMRIAQFLSKLNSKMNTKSSWGDLFNGICSSQIS